MPHFRRILVANRGEIALRVIRTAQEMGIETVAVFSDADRNALHVRRASCAVHLGGSRPAESYLDIDKVIGAAVATGCDALHPGYGFLSEKAAAAEACRAAGIEWLGPPPDAIVAMGDKVQARKIAMLAGVPLVPGLQEDVDADRLVAAAREVGYPVMLKAAAGGGGKGIRIVREEKQLVEAFELARAEARGAFGDDRVYLEKFVTRPRHVEIQIMADKHGNVVHYGERECSVQRRHQKLVEESPCVALTPALRERMGAAACDLARAVGYVGAGTVEFLYSAGEFYFLEMNTRLQVEHPVTEMRYGVDLVREQIRVAAGEELAPVAEPRGHAIEVRVNAEDPNTYFPSLGRLSRMSLPGGPGVRLDSAMFRGLEVTPYYDSMLAKLIVHGEDRAQAIARCERAIRELRIVGVSTAMPVALRVLHNAEFRAGDYDTGILERIDRSLTPERRELAMLAAVAARFLVAERAGAKSADGDGDARQRVPVWSMLGRGERLWRNRS
ncbi:MAG: acetyl-CoA carboxylase biotin carboxylase subunit [Planctomycetes bacterium]|nr:acetyl-CoA carboxylase biotin carboxylase subunit [Planctomycetota bacterium]